MSRLEAEEPICQQQDNIIVISPKSKDLGGFSVRRILPAGLAASVGPFVFVDHMGPAEFPPGEGINVRPHPHIGLATVTFLFEGEILHRDSLGYVQAIQPGAANLMTAGRGIVHSERTSDERMAKGQKLHGMQVWMALPEEHQEIEPDFVHHPATDLPVVEDSQLKTTVIIGAYGNVRSPVEVLTETLYLDQHLNAGATTLLPAAEQRGVYLVTGELTLNGRSLQAGSMAVVNDPGAVNIQAATDSHYMVFGGAALASRHMWWNFVHTSQARIEQAKADWRNNQFDPVPEDAEFIPLPE